MGIASIVAMIVFGFVLIVIEIFITPGFIVGIIGVAIVALGIGYTYKEFGTENGNITLAVSSFLMISGILFAFKQGVWSRLALKDEITSKAANLNNDNVQIGDIGVALSSLRPSGTALINGQKIEVHSESEMLSTNENIEVIKKVNNRIIVKKVAT
jgi:membrane-bound ClpP family serine protease